MDFLSRALQDEYRSSGVIIQVSVNRIHWKIKFKILVAFQTRFCVIAREIKWDLIKWNLF